MIARRRAGWRGSATGWSGSSPLAADPRYRPVTRAMAGILPDARRAGGRQRASPRWRGCRAGIAEVEAAAARRGVARVPGGERHDRRSSTGITTSGGRPTCPGCRGRWCRASSGPTSRSAATIRSRSILADLAGTGVEKSVYVQTQLGEVRAPSTRSPGCRRRPTRTAGRTPSSATPTCSTTSVGEVAEAAGAVSADARGAHAAALAREPACTASPPRPT